MDAAIHIVILTETDSLEKRVALTPEGVQALKKEHEAIRITVETGAGEAPGYADKEYVEAGAETGEDRKALAASADLLLAVNFPPDEVIRGMKKGSAVISFMWALQHADRVKMLQECNVTGVAMDTIPRISRAQSMDALSSMSNIAGYRAAIIGADTLNRYMPMMMTAAGTIPPARVLVLGAGVAGLQAIATAKRLGAIVEAFDVRPVVKEQVESLGASFVEVPLEEDEGDTETKGGYAKELSERNKAKQQEVVHERVKKSDIVITTALIPGRPAPKLVTRAMVEDMKSGSVVVDIAAEQGGNCELTVPGETISHHGVMVCGPLNLPSTLANHASKLYSKNILSLLKLMLKESKLVFPFDDEIVLNATVTHDGELVSPFVKEHS